MKADRQKIPFVLKLKRLKNSKPVRKTNEWISRLQPPKHFKGKVQKILLFRNDKIGDAVVTLPVIRDIKHNYPEIKIEVIASPRNRFIFEKFPFVDNIIELNIHGEHSGFFKIPIIGGFLLFSKYIILQYILSKEFRKKIKYLTQSRFDVSVDLVGLKRNSLIMSFVSGFSIGPGRLLAFLFYDYYLKENWVSANDIDYMSKKIENSITIPLGLQLVKRNTGIPFFCGQTVQPPDSNKYDIIFHFGSGALRKLSIEKESELVKEFSQMNVLVTDSRKAESFNKLKNLFADNNNITFRLFETLEELSALCKASKLLFCYDGGQAHYLSQYVRTITVFGPGSAALWKPYEFAGYEETDSDGTGSVAKKSMGKFGHLIIYRPMWCNPCFDTGCATRPCLGEITTSFIIEVIRKYGFSK